MASNDLVWEEGDIAFLRGVAELNDGERRALAGYVPPKATGHPVIVLEHTPGSKYCTITTVSAYGSGSHNRFLAPWDQPAHKRKSRGAFFAFAGSEKPADWQEHLELEDNGCWPKPKTSVCYTKCSLLPLFNLFPQTSCRYLAKQLLTSFATVGVQPERLRSPVLDTSRVPPGN